jgi:hypothetical protein
MIELAVAWAVGKITPHKIISHMAGLRSDPLYIGLLGPIHYIWSLLYPNVEFYVFSWH